MKSAGTLVSAFVLSTVTLSSVFAAKADHHQIAKSLEKRSFSGQATYFVDGLGACGITNGPGDFIVALNTPQYGGGSPGPECFKTITINAGGKSAQATITDECPSCAYGSLDFSEGLFQHFNDLSVGEFPITWSYNDGSGGGGGGNGDQSTTKHTTHRTTPAYTPPAPTTTSHHTTSTSIVTTSTTHTSPTTTKKARTSTTSSSAPTTTTSAAPIGGNLEELNQLVIEFADLLHVAAGGN